MLEEQEERKFGAQRRVMLVCNCIIMQVGHITKGINPRSAHKIFFTGHYLAAGAKIGIVAAFIALTVRKLFSLHCVQPSMVG
jgi:hypothetical protein